MNIRVLIVEDEQLIRWSLRQKFEERGYNVTEAEDGAAADAALVDGAYDLIMLDLKLPDTTGIEVLRKVRQKLPDAAIIMMTAYSTVDTAVEAIKLGAFSYVAKPFQMEALLKTVDEALDRTRIAREAAAHRSELRHAHGFDILIGNHPDMQVLYDMIGRVADAGGSTVFVRGETGTGKDLVARVVHNCSPRAAQPFINVTCTALTESLLESELFGHERGAFTDAKAQKKGLFELADGGTIFLDEVGDMPAALQAKLLRFLEERKFRRVGGTDEISVDVRVIAATNRDIEAAIDAGEFRSDLLYRLNVVTLTMPPLRTRGEDIRLLARHFVDKFAKSFNRPITGIDESAYIALENYSWPGNVREMRNVMERAVLLSKSETISAGDMMLARDDATSWSWDITRIKLPEEGFDLDKLTQLEGHLLQQAMDRTQKNQTQAAKLLNLSRDQLRYRLQKHNLFGGDT